jgi:hypothetical protein
VEGSNGPKAIRVLSVSSLEEDLGRSETGRTADLGLDLGVFDIGVGVGSKDLGKEGERYDWAGKEKADGSGRGRKR